MVSCGLELYIPATYEYQFCQLDTKVPHWLLNHTLTWDFNFYILYNTLDKNIDIYIKSISILR